MVRNVIKRFGALALSLALMLTMMPLTTMTAYAASGTLNTGITGLSVSYDGGTWSMDSGTITGSVTTKKKSSCLGDTYTTETGTLTLTNNSGEKAILRYNLSLTSGGGSLTDSGNGSIVLENGSSITITATSKDEAEDTTVIRIDNLELTPVNNVTITFKPAEHGSYTVNGESITSTTEKIQSSDEAFNLVATPATGYKFRGWQDGNGTFVSTASSESLLLAHDDTITATFVPNDTAIFDVEGTSFTDLNEATDYATNTGKNKIVLISNGTLPSGNYSIPSGKLLLIPFDSAYTSVTTGETVLYNQYVTPSAYGILKLATGSHIDVYGSISLASEMAAKGQLAGWNGTPSGPDGRIDMQSGSSIAIKNGGML